MNAQAVEAAWQDSRESLTKEELSAASGLGTAELDELVDYGSLVPLQDGASPERKFSAVCVAPLRTATRLRADFDLDLFTMSLVLGYLHRIEVLEREVAALRTRVPGHPHVTLREGPEPWREPHG